MGIGAEHRAHKDRAVLGRVFVGGPIEVFVREGGFGVDLTLS